MLPKAFVSKMKPYAIEFSDATVTVDVFDPFWTSESILEEKLSEFEKRLTPERRLAGIGFKQDPSNSYCWLLLCIRNHGLIIKLVQNAGPVRFSSEKMSCLEKILSDPTICFVGVNFTDTAIMNSKRIAYGYDRVKFSKLKINAWEIDHLVARIHQKPALLSCVSLQKLATEVGLDIKPNITHNKSIDWNAKVFSKEDIKFAIYDVYYSSRIADKLMYG